MSKGRKSGCPTNVRDWVIAIQDKAQAEETWVRIYGITQIRRSASSTTQDGSAASDLWEEPYITKRSATFNLEGNPVVDGSTGNLDEGQEMLNDYAERDGCDGDCTLKFIDPYGHAMVADYIVESNETNATDTENTVSWGMRQVGEAETLPYVQVSSIALKDGTNAITTLSLAEGSTPKVITVAFTPDDASNQRFRVSLSGKRYAEISNVTENTFSITPISVGTATIMVTSMNGRKTASLTVTVTAE